MTRYRIVCTEQQPAYLPPSHAHIVAVGTGTSNAYWDRQWTLADVLAAMDRGDSFYTRSESTGREAAVHKYVCQHCRQTFIRSAADAVTDNNLDNLNTCQWAPAHSRY